MAQGRAVASGWERKDAIRPGSGAVDARRDVGDDRRQPGRDERADEPNKECEIERSRTYTQR